MIFLGLSDFIHQTLLFLTFPFTIVWKLRTYWCPSRCHTLMNTWSQVITSVLNNYLKTLLSRLRVCQPSDVCIPLSFIFFCCWYGRGPVLIVIITFVFIPSYKLHPGLWPGLNLRPTGFNVRDRRLGDDCPFLFLFSLPLTIPSRNTNLRPTRLDVGYWSLDESFLLLIRLCCLLFLLALLKILLLVLFPHSLFPE